MDNDQRTIMAVGAHHDDNELVAGTLARHREAGWRVVSVVMTNGVYIAGKVSESHVAIRENESREAAKLLGSVCVFLRFPEGNFQPTDESKLALVREIRKYKPSIILTHPPRDYHLDHMNTSRCVYEAAMMAWNPCVLQDLPTCPNPKLYYSDAWFVPFDPDEYVDITKYIDLKVQMLCCHKSQLSTAGMCEGDMVDHARQQSRIRGIQAGVKYAESFRLMTNMGSVRLSPLLGG
jgi:N-acetylglucosamine malate deacetylase 1